MVFQIGQFAVYPLHGVGRIQGITIREIGGETVEMYDLSILENGMKVMVPVSGAESVGLRDLVPIEDIPPIFEVLKEEAKKIDAQTWNRRYRDYMGKIRTGSPLEVAAVLRDLAAVKNHKNLSFGERKMYDTAHSLLVCEIALTREVPNAQVVEEIERVLSGGPAPTVRKPKPQPPKRRAIMRRAPAKKKVAKRAPAKKKVAKKAPAKKKVAKKAPAKKKVAKKAPAKKKTTSKKKR